MAPKKDAHGAGVIAPAEGHGFLSATGAEKF
jgi:hypothetical protein